MATLQQRSRIVVFRLTEDEYDTLRSACDARGRSMSDYTRTELLTQVKSDPRNTMIERRFAELDRRMEDLHDLLLQVSEYVGIPQDARKKTLTANEG